MAIAISSGERARDGLALDQEKWRLPRSGKCPLLDTHNDRSGIRSILGRVSDFEVRTIDLASGGRGKALLGTATFADTPEGECALQLYRSGFADSFSVSFIPNWTSAPSRETPASQELLEVSCVAIPADINSVVLARALSRQERGSSLTAADRRAIAAAIAWRVERDDAEARDSRTREERLAVALRLQQGPL